MNARPSPNDFLSPSAIAGLLEVSIHTVYKWSARGWPHFPRHLRLPNGEIRVSGADFDEWVASRRKAA